MADFLYYWQRFSADTASGEIYKLNQGSPILNDVAVGDDLWAIGLSSPSTYALLARLTVCEVGQNRAGSPDDKQYGKYYIRSSPSLANYFSCQTDAEGLVRSLSIKCDAATLGQSFQGWSAVRKLSEDDRRKLIAFASTI